MTYVPAGDERRLHDVEHVQSLNPGMYRLPAVEFERICAGAITGDTMAFLEKSQYSQRKLALRALLDQLEGSPHVLGTLLAPLQVWRILASAERRKPEAVSDILLYPSVGVWLTRALHHTRRDEFTGIPWAELGYLQVIAAAAAISCQTPCVIQVPVWHGVVSLPTVGHLRLPADIPVDVADLTCSEQGVWVRALDGQVSIDVRYGIPNATFVPIKRHVSVRRGQALTATIDDIDPYRGFGAPEPPAELDHTDLAEWRKMLDEAWDVLTASQPALAEELAAGLRALAPIGRGLGTVGASSAAAFGGVVLSAAGSAIQLAETLTHELQHSKLNAVLAWVKLATDDGECRFYAPWRDDPRPLTGLLHGIYAFTCGVEFMLAQLETAPEPNERHTEFTFAHRRHQLRHAVNTLRMADPLTEYGHQLVAAVDSRLTICERRPIASELSRLVEMIVADHNALWRLWFVRPDRSTVESLCAAWLGESPPHPSPLVAIRSSPATREQCLGTAATCCARWHVSLNGSPRPGPLEKQTPHCALATTTPRSPATGTSSGPIRTTLTLG